MRNNDKRRNTRARQKEDKGDNCVEMSEASATADEDEPGAAVLMNQLGRKGVIRRKIM